jgi:hypothetical protein
LFARIHRRSAELGLMAGWMFAGENLSLADEGLRGGLN